MKGREGMRRAAGGVRDEVNFAVGMTSFLERRSAL